MMTRKTPTAEEQVIRAQLWDWGRWRRLQSYGVGYTNPNNVRDVEECFNEEVSEEINRVVILLKKAFAPRAQIVKLYYVDRMGYVEIANLLGTKVNSIRNQKMIAEGWIDHAINYS